MFQDNPVSQNCNNYLAIAPIALIQSSLDCLKNKELIDMQSIDHIFNSQSTNEQNRQTPKTSVTAAQVTSWIAEASDRQILGSLDLDKASTTQDAAKCNDGKIGWYRAKQSEVFCKSLLILVLHNSMSKNLVKRRRVDIM